MWVFSCLVPFLVISQPQATMGEAELRLEVYPREIAWGDLVYIQITAINPTTHSVKLPGLFSEEAASLALEVRSVGDQTGVMYQERTSGCAVVGLRTLPAGYSAIVAQRTLSIPFYSQRDDPVWGDASKESQRELVITVSDHGQKPAVSVSLSQTLRIRPRPVSEHEWLNQLLAKAAFPPANYSLRYQIGDSAVHRALQSVAPIFELTCYVQDQTSVLEAMIEGEQNLGPGTLKNSVLMGLRISEIVSLPREASAERLGKVDELLTWLQTVPPIERDALARHIRRYSQMAAGQARYAGGDEPIELLDAWLDHGLETGKFHENASP